VAPEIRYAFGRLRTGRASVAAVAAEIGWSTRHLTGRFHAEIGVRPKEAARLGRFDNTRRALGPAVRPADVAATHGFADQSHLIREFHAFAGCTPSHWLAEEFAFVQSPAAPLGDDDRHER
jgi:transcriptional regulator GlxA family with amidase domain